MKGSGGPDVAGPAGLPRGGSPGSVEPHTPPQFFVDPSMVLGSQIELTGDVFRHAKAARLSPREVFRATQGETVYEAVVDEVLPDRLVATITDRRRVAAPRARVHLLAALLKGQNFDLVVEKATEIGVTSIIPVVTMRTIPRLEPAKAADRRVRWQKVAKAASEQCGRGIVPDIGDVVSFDDLMARAACGGIHGVPLLAYEHDGLTVPLDKALGRSSEASVIIGPEGGLDAPEVKLALGRGFVPISLGPYILKAETASMAAATLLVHYLSQERR